MNSTHTLGGIFLTLSSLSSHLGQVSNAANVSMSIRKPFTRSNLERWMEDSLRTFLTCSFFSPWKGYLIENKPELTKVPNSTTFLPLFKAGTSPQHPPEVGAPRRQKGARGVILQAWRGRRSPKAAPGSPAPCVMPMITLHYMRKRFCRHN